MANTIYYASTTSMATLDSSGLSFDADGYLYRSYADIRPTVPRSLVRCEYCRVKNDWDAHFCEACGAPLPDN